MSKNNINVYVIGIGFLILGIVIGFLLFGTYQNTGQASRVLNDSNLYNSHDLLQTFYEDNGLNRNFNSECWGAMYDWCMAQGAPAAQCREFATNFSGFPSICEEYLPAQELVR